MSEPEPMSAERLAEMMRDKGLPDGWTHVDCGHATNVQTGAYLECSFCGGYFCSLECLEAHLEAHNDDTIRYAW